MAEVMAIKEALSWSKTQERGMIEIESDCLGIVQAVRSEVPMVSLVGSVIEKCRALLEDCLLNGLPIWLLIV